MQKNLEILKNADGIIIKKLSHKKILIEYSIPLFYNQNDTEPFFHLELRMRYVVGEFPDYQISHLISSVGLYNENYPNMIGFKLIPPKPAFWAGLSNKLRVKMKHICVLTDSNVSIELDKDFDEKLGKKNTLNIFYKGIYFSDEIWKREHKLQKLLC